jgi:hypothetical protein
MKRGLLATLLLLLTIAALSGCGGGGDGRPPSVTTQILSQAGNDGDISLDLTNTPVVSQGNPVSVLAGFNATTGTEFRAFLDFSLTGAGGVPGAAIIDSAFLDIFVDSLSIAPAAATVPIRIDLVSFPPQALAEQDFSRPALATRRTFIRRADVNQHVSIDVTGLMVEAQARQLSDFQVRISEDVNALPDGAFDGLVEIHEATLNRAPLLEVTYH